MQIHELNSFSGTPGSSDYLVTDNGTDTSKISATDLIAPAVDAVATETTTRQSADNLLQAQIDQFVAPSGTAPNPTEIENARVGADGVTYTTLGEAIRTQVSDLKSDLNVVDSSIRFNTLASYLYKRDTCFNTSNPIAEESKTGYDLFKVPCEEGDFIHVSWTSSTAPYDGLSPKSIFIAWENASGTVARGLDALHWCIYDTTKEMMFVAPANCKYTYFCVKRTQISDVVIQRNYPYDFFNDDYKRNFVIPINGNSAVKSYLYLRNTDQIYALNNDTYSIWWLPVKQGDKVKFKSPSITGLSMVATFKDSSNVVTHISDSEYTFADDGVLCVFDLAANVGNATLFPLKQLKVDSSNVIGLPSDFENVWDTLSQSDRKLKIIAGAIRNTGDGWQFISDANHAPVNCQAVSTQDGDILLSYGFTAKKVVSLLIAPDETFAKIYSVGGSVGNSASLFRIARKVQTYGGYVNYSGGQWVRTNSTFTNVSFNSSTGKLSLYHESLASLPSSAKFMVSASGRDCDVRVSEIGDNYFNVVFLDSEGNIKTTPDTSMKVYAHRTSPQIDVDASGVTSASGNFWIFGVMEVE